MTTAAALASAAVLLFGVAFGIGRATRGDGQSPIPSGAQKVVVPAAPSAPRLTTVGAVPKLRARPEQPTNSTDDSVRQTKPVPVPEPQPQPQRPAPGDEAAGEF